MKRVIANLEYVSIVKPLCPMIILFLFAVDTDSIYKFVFRAIRKNRLGFINPSPDESANSIISINSSSVMFSPSSKQTRCKSLKMTAPNAEEKKNHNMKNATMK